MKKQIFLIFLIILLLTGCAPLQQQTDKTKVVATIFPLYDFTFEVSNSGKKLVVKKNGKEFATFRTTAK